MLLTMPISIRVRGGIESGQSLYSSGCSGAAADRRLPVVRGILSRRNGGRPPRGGAQRPIQVLDDVLDMLDADAEADRFGSNTGAFQLLRGHLPVRALRQDVLHQCARHLFHRAEGRSAYSRRRLGRAGRIRRASEGYPLLRDLRRDEGGHSFFRPQHGGVNSASFSPDGTHVVTASEDKTARVWDLRGKQPTFVALEGHHQGLFSASFSPDGTHVVTASWDKTARVWDLRGERPSFVALEGHQGSVNSASFSPDGTHVVTASEDKTARVWNLRGEQPSFVALEGDQGSVNSASFSPDGTHVVTASWDKTARVWDLRGERPSFVALEGHQDIVRSASFSPDGTHVVTASYDKTARVWDLRGERPSFVALEGHQDIVWSASFSPDGTHVVTASWDKTARVWRSFPDVNKLIGIVRAGLSRCLSQAERDAYGLGSGPTVLPTLQVPVVPADRSFIPLTKQDGSCD